jgi:hypothetical protein
MGPSDRMIFHLALLLSTFIPPISMWLPNFLIP